MHSWSSTKGSQEQQILGPACVNPFPLMFAGKKKVCVCMREKMASLINSPEPCSCTSCSMHGKTPAVSEVLPTSAANQTDGVQGSPVPLPLLALLALVLVWFRSFLLPPTASLPLAGRKVPLSWLLLVPTAVEGAESHQCFFFPRPFPASLSRER